MAVTMPTVLWTYRARLERVLDGDTYSLELDLGLGVRKAGVDNHIRLAGVSCPETFGPTLAAGLAAKAFAAEWLQPVTPVPWPLIIQTERIRDAEVRTFTRWVAHIWRLSDGANLADDLVMSGLGVRGKG